MKRLGTDYLTLAYAAVFFALTALCASDSEHQESERLLVAPPPYIEKMQFGFSQSVADSFWLRWVQDVDTCYVFGKELVHNDELDADAQIKKKQEDRFFNPRYKFCDNSWAFKMLDAVTKLDQRFKMPYLLGAPALAVMVEDYEGAGVIFDRGLSVYPKDWSLNYRAAYHYMYDKQDLPKAAHLLNVAAENGGPSWLPSLAARIYTRTGQLEFAITSLEAYRKAFTDEKQIRDLDKRIAGLKAQLSKEQK